MTTKELLGHICDANDGGVPKVAIFSPAITNVSRKKKGPTTITFVVKTDEFFPSDALDGLWACVAIGTTAQVQRLMEGRIQAEFAGVDSPDPPKETP